MMHLDYIDNWRFKQFYNLEMYQILNQEVKYDYIIICVYLSFLLYIYIYMMFENALINIITFMFTRIKLPQKYIFK